MTTTGSPSNQLSSAEDEVAGNTTLVEMRSLIDALRAYFTEDPPKAHPFTQLGGDDLGSKPYQVSHAAWSALSQSIDTLLCAYDLTVVPKTETHVTVNTRPHAVYPMLRAAYENAHRCAWLAGGPTRKERIQRRLRFQMTDASMQDQATQLLPNAIPRVEADVLTKLKAIAAPHGISNTKLKHPVTYAEIVRDGAQALGCDANTSLATWRLLSGLTHGDYWANFTVLDREEIGTSHDNKIVTFKTTTSASKLSHFMLITAVTVRETLDLYLERSSKKFPESV